MTLETTPTRLAMTADDARSFQGYSVANALAVKTALAARGCTCEPYEDVFTFNRWRAQGRAVRRGEHGIRLVVFVTMTRGGEDADGVVDEPRAFSAPRASYVFCRCQTDELGARRGRYSGRGRRSASGGDARERHNGAHQLIRDGAPMLYGDHYSDECADPAARFPRDYAPGTGERADDDPPDDD